MDVCVSELEAMMRECSDFSAPQKASKFTKPSVKELAPSIQQRYTFAASNKSRDWKNLQGLDEVFVTKRPRKILFKLNTFDIFYSCFVNCGIANLFLKEI